MTKQRRTITIAISAGVVFILATLFFIARGVSERVAPAPPRIVTPVPLPPPVPSTISMKAELPMHEISRLAKSALNDYFGKPLQLRYKTVTASLNLRAGAPAVAGAGDRTVTLKIPVRIGGSARFPVDLWVTVIKKTGKISAHATVSLTLTPTLSSDWRITVEMESDVVVHKAELKTSGIFTSRTVSIRGVLARLAKEEMLPELEKTVAGYIADIDLRNHVAGLWRKLREPIVLNRELPLTLIVAPDEVFAQQLKVGGDALSFNLGVKAQVRAIAGDASTDPPFPPGPRSELPDIRFVDSLEPGCRIFAPIEISYAALEDLARPHVERELKLEGVVLESLTLYGSGARLAAGVGFKTPFLRVKGQFHMLGTPRYDAATMSVSVADFESSFTTRSLLLKIAESIGVSPLSTLRTSVEEKMVFPISALRETVSSIISNRRIGRHVRLRGTVDALAPEAFHLTQAGVRVSLRLQGDLACRISL